MESNVKAALRCGGNTPPEASTSLRSRKKYVPDSKYYILGDVCILCGEKITEEFLRNQLEIPVSRRNIVCTIETLEKIWIRETTGRAGEWGQQIIQRFSCISDLVAAECSYHLQCRYKLFCTAKSSGGKRGRPVQSQLLQGMDSIYAFLAETTEEPQFSLSNLFTNHFQAGD